MLYDKLPRPVTTPDARERARALLGAAQRRQNLFAQSLIQAETRAQSSDLPPPTTAGLVGAPSSSLDQLMQHITQASDQDLVRTHQTLTEARALAQRQMGADAELASFMAAAYGTLSSELQAPVPADVVDVLARELVPGTAKDGAPQIAPTPSEATGHTGD